MFTPLWPQVVSSRQPKLGLMQALSKQACFNSQLKAQMVDSTGHWAPCYVQWPAVARVNDTCVFVFTLLTSSGWCCELRRCKWSYYTTAPTHLSSVMCSNCVRHDLSIGGQVLHSAFTCLLLAGISRSACVCCVISLASAHRWQLVLLPLRKTNRSTFKLLQAT